MPWDEAHSPWRKGGDVIAGGVKFLALVALPFYLLDQLTKWWVYTHYALEPTNREILERFMDVVMKTSHLMRMKDASCLT